MLRGTAQGFTFGVARVLPRRLELLRTRARGGGIGPVAALLAAFLLVSGVVGFFFMPNTAGKSLEQIERERATA